MQFVVACRSIVFVDHTLKASVIAQIFARRQKLELQLSAPLLQERERYLAYLFQNGVSRQSVRTAACMLLHVVRLMSLERMRPVSISEIRQAGDQWLHDPLVHTTRAVGPSSADSFVGAALRWFRFHDLLANENPVDALDEVFQRYLDFQRSKALSTATLRGLRSHLLSFLDRLREESISLESLRLIDIDRYLAQKKSDGCKPRSIVTTSRALRSFIRLRRRSWLDES